MVHSAQWDPSVDVTGKRVGVIGTGASAIQIVPAIAATVRSLTVYQRSAAWVLPKRDRPTWAVERWAYRYIPLLQFLVRAYVYAYREWLAVGFFKFPSLLKESERMAVALMKQQLPDRPDLWDKLTPHYRAGCKRILLSNEYYKVGAGGGDAEAMLPGLLSPATLTSCRGCVVRRTVCRPRTWWCRRSKPSPPTGSPPRMASIRSWMSSSWRRASTSSLLGVCSRLCVFVCSACVQGDGGV